MVNPFPTTVAIACRTLPVGWLTWSGLVGVGLWLGLGTLTVALGGLLLTRWRRLPAWKKCLLVSGMLHLWVLLALSTISIPTAPLPEAPEAISFTLVDGPADGQMPQPQPEEEAPIAETPFSQNPDQLHPVAPPPLEQAPEAVPTWIRTALGAPAEETRLAGSGPAEGKTEEGQRQVAAVARAEPAGTTAVVPQVHEMPDTAQPAAATSAPADRWPRWSAATLPGEKSPSDPSAEISAGNGTAMMTLPNAVCAEQLGEVASAAYHIPAPYRWRVAPDRLELARRFGASEESEKAVHLALEWLAANQDPDGRWNPRRHGAGQERYEAGRDRQGAGSRADTGITGLALLAFAAAGNTHRQGQYAATVEKALKYLLATQAPDGNLGGPAATYEFMYCHGIATLAISEIFGLSGDPRLRPPVASAVAYTVASQDPWGGGWRYRPQEAGDTSQLGWQLMALKSAQLASIPIPQSTWDGAARYLEGVSAGNHGGLAAYRPGERITRTMTAEALVCRLLLGLPPAHPAAREAGDSLLAELPGEGVPNRYYWYYATMAMYQLQGSHWELWNRALQKTLLATQRRDGTLAGSWDPTTRWDGYGGRVYATALATLCLEAYYRFLPPHADVPPGGPPVR